MKTCCFIGHREVRRDISQSLDAAIERHIVRYGVTDFLVGNYGAFDRMSAAAVKRAKARYPQTRLTLMLPYMPQRGRALPDVEGYDSVLYPSEMDGVPLRLAIPRLNRLMVESSDYAIAYVLHSWGGAATTLERAKRREQAGKLKIVNLGEA